ncbi:MAG TPA: CHASE3 domain-containing protein [Alphaproteobacteria bacterium]|nr:CHASE3 domain-containing protein [Alphaproteobacteria bacterium]
MAVVAFVAADIVKQLNTATKWRRHSADVILSEQSVQNNLLEIQRGVRGYVTLGDTNALNSFYGNVAVEPSQLWELSAFTKDNPGQEKRAHELADAVTALIAFDKKAIAVYQRDGFGGIAKLDKTGEGRAAFGRVQDILDLFSAKEQRLWDVRDVSEQNQYHYTGQFLIGACALAIVLLLLAHHMASRELQFRRRAEDQLRQTLLLQNAILDSADYGIVATDTKGVVQTFNRAAQRLLGYSAAEVVGKATPLLWRDQTEMARAAENLSKQLGVPVNPGFEAIAKKVQLESVDEGEWTYIRKDGSRFPCMSVITALGKDSGAFTGFIGLFRDISDRRKHDQEREQLIAQLKNALAEVKTLHGLIPICAWCKNVRSDSGYWQTVEQYVHSHSGASFSHGMCPNCAAKFKQDIARANQKSEITARA